MPSIMKCRSAHRQPQPGGGFKIFKAEQLIDPDALKAEGVTFDESYFEPETDPASNDAGPRVQAPSGSAKKRVANPEGR